MGSGSWHSSGKPCQIQGGIRCFETVPASYLSRQQIISLLMEDFCPIPPVWKGSYSVFGRFVHLLPLGAADTSPLLDSLYLRKISVIIRGKRPPHPGTLAFAM